MATESTKTRSAVYIACEEMDHTWKESQLQEFSRLWKDGFTIIQIASYFRRPVKEVVILAVDLIDKRRLDELLGERYSG